MKPLLCFDLDNTLIHADKAHVKSYNKSLKSLKLPTKKFKEIAIHFGKPKEEVAKAILPKSKKNLSNKLNNLHDHYLTTEYYTKAKKIKGVKKTLKKLKINYKIAILSNCQHRNIQYLLKGAKINKDIFNYIIGNDDVKHPKPYPDEIFKAQKLAKTKALAMIGDSPYDIRAGKKAKTKTISVLTGLYTKKRLKKEKPNFILDSIKDLPKLLQKKHI